MVASSSLHAQSLHYSFYHRKLWRMEPEFVLAQLMVIVPSVLVVDGLLWNEERHDERRLD